MTRFYITSYEPERGQPRTTPEIICERCVDSIRRDRYTWALHTEQVPADKAPTLCPWCQPGQRVSA